MIIWRGWGFLVLAIPFALLIAAQVGLETFVGANAWKDNNSMAIPAVGLAAAIVTWILGRWLNRESNHHTLFWIPAQYWAFIWLALSGVVYYLELIAPAAA